MTEGILPWSDRDRRVTLRDDPRTFGVGHDGGLEWEVEGRRVLFIPS